MCATFIPLRAPLGGYVAMMSQWFFDCALRKRAWKCMATAEMNGGKKKENKYTKISNKRYDTYFNIYPEQSTSFTQPLIRFDCRGLRPHSFLYCFLFSRRWNIIRFVLLFISRWLCLWFHIPPDNIANLVDIRPDRCLIQWRKVYRVSQIMDDPLETYRIILTQLSCMQFYNIIFWKEFILINKRSGLNCND